MADPDAHVQRIQERMRSALCAQVDVLMRQHGLPEPVAVQVTASAAIGALLDFYCTAAVSAGMTLHAAQQRVATALATTITDQRARSNPANLN